jgi:dienelactone hydrolase
VNSKLLDGRANPNFLRPYIEAAGPFSNRNVPNSATPSTATSLTIHADKLPRWLNWIGTQRLGAHLERNRIDTEAYTYGQWIADDHAWTNRANRVAVPRSPSATTSATTRVKISTTATATRRTSTARIRYLVQQPHRPVGQRIHPRREPLPPVHRPCP